MTSMTIGQLARRAGIRPSAIRYYEAQRLLPPPPRSGAAYRLYGPEALTLLRFVARSKELGFSLEETRQLIGSSKDDPPCILCRKFIERHLEEVEGQLERLRSLRDRLKRLLHQPEPERAVGGICPLVDGSQ